MSDTDSIRSTRNDKKSVAEDSHDMTWGTKNEKKPRRRPDAARSDYFVANWSRASCADKRSP